MPALVVEERPEVMVGVTIEGQHRILRLLDMGGMGVVYEAIHENTRHRVAVKILSSAFSDDERWIERLFLEAQAVNLVNHPGLVRIYSCGFLEGFPQRRAYLLMELLHGESCRSRVVSSGHAGAPVLQATALRIGRQVADAMAAVHAHSIIHRDLKPENLFLVADPEVPGGERVKILDFGVAKSNNNLLTSRATTADRVFGTAAYMSPEQCRGMVLTGRSDVYALGVILYELLAGQLPFYDENAISLMSKHLRDDPLPLCEACPQVPVAVGALVGEMMSKEPTSRPSMAEVAERLTALEKTAAQGPLSPAAQANIALAQTATAAPLPAVTGGERAQPRSETRTDRRGTTPSETEAFDALPQERWVRPLWGLLLTTLLLLSVIGAWRWLQPLKAHPRPTSGSPRAEALPPPVAPVPAVSPAPKTAAPIAEVPLPPAPTPPPASASRRHRHRRAAPAPEEGEQRLCLAGRSCESASASEKGAWVPTGRRHVTLPEVRTLTPVASP